MKVQVVSDLHLETRPVFAPIEVADGVDVLVLAGDIVSARTNHLLFDLLEGHDDLTKIYVPGNHEAYRGNIGTYQQGLREICDAIPNTHFLNPGHLQIDNVLFIGATLWTHIEDEDKKDALQFMNDFNVVEDQNITNWQMTNGEHRNYIEQELRTSRELKRVVITHFTPSYLSQAPRWRFSGISSCFHNNLNDLIELEQPEVWIHGHTHDRFDYKIGETRIICNPQGYPGEKADGVFNPLFTFDI